MFECDPYKRLTINNIQQNEWFAKCNESDEVQFISDFKFEAKGRSLYHSNITNKQQKIEKLETIRSNSNNSNSDGDSSSNFKVIDLSKVSTSQFKNLSIQTKQNLFQRNVFSMINPLVVMVGIADYDYKHVIDVFYGMEEWNVMFKTTNNKTKCLSQSNKKDNLKISKTCNQCNVFARIENESDENDDCKYDGLIYILSANTNNDYGQHTLYDSKSNQCPIGQIFDKFNNVNNRPSINNQLNKYAFDKSKQLSKFHQMKLYEKHKFIIFYNMESCSRSCSDNHGGY